MSARAPKDDDLGRFLRSRREAVTPAEVGLPAGGRRRTPGLRRAELATLADISVDYLVRLEQGRDRRPSAQVLAALADALRLGPEERQHLARLSAIPHKRELYGAPGPPAESVRPAVQAVLRHLDPAPAYVINRLGALLAWTPAFERLAGPVGLLDCDHPNLVRFTFGHPRAREAFPDWDRVADEVVGHLRTAVYTCEDAPAVALVEELTLAAGAPFTERWRSAPALPGPAPAAPTLRLRHPEGGVLRLAPETLHLADADAQQLVVLLPADDATTAALDRITGRHPGALRAVSGD